MTEQKKILDLGCGDGLTTFFLSKKGKVIGVDLNTDQAKKKFPNLNFLSANAEKLPFDKNTFDKVYCFDVLEHVDNVDKTLEQITKVLKKGGHLVAEIPFWKSEKFLLKIRPSYHQEIHHQRIFKRNELEKRLKNNFKLIKRKKLRGIDNLKLYFLFKKKAEIINQQGELSNPNSFFLESFYLLFKKDLFKTKLKWFFPVWFITWPIGLIINQIFPKTIYLKFIKL